MSAFFWALLMAFLMCFVAMPDFRQKLGSKVWLNLEEGSAGSKVVYALSFVALIVYFAERKQMSTLCLALLVAFLVCLVVMPDLRQKVGNKVGLNLAEASSESKMAYVLLFVTMTCVASWMMGWFLASLLALGVFLYTQPKHQEALKNCYIKLWMIADSNGRENDDHISSDEIVEQAERNASDQIDGEVEAAKGKRKKNKNKNL